MDKEKEYLKKLFNRLFVQLRNADISTDICGDIHVIGGEPFIEIDDGGIIHIRKKDNAPELMVEIKFKDVIKHWDKMHLYLRFPTFGKAYIELRTELPYGCYDKFHIKEDSDFIKYGIGIDELVPFTVNEIFELLKRKYPRIGIDSIIDEAAYRCLNDSIRETFQVGMDGDILKHCSFWKNSANDTTINYYLVDERNVSKKTIYKLDKEYMRLFKTIHPEDINDEDDYEPNELIDSIIKACYYMKGTIKCLGISENFN